jgi:hypothetical protein
MMPRPDRHPYTLRRLYAVSGTQLWAAWLIRFRPPTGGPWRELVLLAEGPPAPEAVAQAIRVWSEGKVTHDAR